MMEEVIVFKGHKNVRATHRTTIEITKERELTIKGDCIIGVCSNKACYDLSENFKNRIRNNNSIVKITLIVEPYSFTFKARGDSSLRLEDRQDIVIRKSSFICGRTLCINSKVASIDIPREMIGLLQNDQRVGIMLISLE